MATNVLRRLSVSPETTWGTAVTPATKVMGVTAITPRLMQDVHQTEELGTIAPSSLIALVRESGGFGIGMDLSYEDICFPLNSIDTPAITGAGPYTYTYVLPSTSAGAFTGYTMLMEWGAEIATEYQAEGCIAEGISISGDISGDGVWQCQQDWLAEKLSATSGTSSPADRTVEKIRMSDTVLYLDAIAGTIGTTLKSSTLISFNWSLTSGRHLKHFAGSLYPLDYGRGRWGGQLSLVCELNADTISVVGSMFGATASRQVRLAGTSGTKVAWLDFAGYLAAPPLELDKDRDGNSTVELVFNAAYNSPLGSFAGAKAVNGMATWP